MCYVMPPRALSALLFNFHYVPHHCRVCRRRCWTNLPSHGMSAAAAAAAAAADEEDEEDEEEGGREGEEDLSVKPSFGRRTAGGQLTSVAVAAAVALKISCYTVAVPSVLPSVPRRRRRQSRFSILLLRQRGRGHRSQPMVSRVSTTSLGIN